LLNGGIVGVGWARTWSEIVAELEDYAEYVRRKDEAIKAQQQGS
jgi:hypothetical protein